MNIKQATGFTAAQVRAMTTDQYNALLEKLEDENFHTGVVMAFAARNNRGTILKALEALDDMHQAIQHCEHIASATWRKAMGMQ